MGLSPTNAGLSLMTFLIAMNTSAGLAGQVLGRVRHYKRLPLIMLALAIGAVTILAVRADDKTPAMFVLLLILIGAGFGPLPSLGSVAVQNVVARHELGISIGALNFSRNLLSTILIAAFGAMVLAGVPAGEQLSDAFAADAGRAAHGFAAVFFTTAASFSIAFIAIALMEERRLQTNAELDAK
jgi:MFS family permease